MSGDLLESIKCDSETMESVLDRYEIDINALSERGESLLHLAISRGNSKVVRELLKHEVDVNVTTSYGETSLHQAASRGLVDIVKVLLEKGADPNSRMALSGESSLHLATRGGHTEVVEVLLDVGRHANVNAFSKCHETALHIASAKNDQGVAKILLEKGATANVVAKGKAPLHHAVVHGNNELSTMLCAFGASANLPDRRGNTPLFMAAKNSHVSIAKMLLTQGAHVNIKGELTEDTRPWIGEYRETPLHVSSRQGDAELVELFLKNGADVDMPTADFELGKDRPWFWIMHRETALHLAADGGHADVIKLLLKSGAEMSNVDIEGNMPHHLALHSGHHQALHCLLLRGCPLNATDGDRKSALHQAFHLRDYESAVLLIMHGASITTRRCQLGTVLQIISEDVNCDPVLYQALFYCGNGRGPITSNLDVEVPRLQAQNPSVYEWLQRELSTPQPLKHICRKAIRKHVRSLSKRQSIWILVDNLPFPSFLKRYILLDEFSAVKLNHEVCPRLTRRASVITLAASPIVFGFHYEIKMI